MRRAFTLIELLVVISIIVILTTISVIALKPLLKGNGVAEGTNLVRAMLANARSIAISQHRQVAAVFYEQTSDNALPLSKSQTAVILAGEDRNQSQYSPAEGNTVFVPLNGVEVQYVPRGIQVSTLGGFTITDPVSGKTTQQMHTGTTGTTAYDRCRAIVFNSDGQLVTRDGLAVANPTGNPGTPTRIVGDWNFSAPTDTNPATIDATHPPTLAESSPGVLIYDREDFNSQTFTNDYQRSQWLQQHGNLLVINAYTGGIIR